MHWVPVGPNGNRIKAKRDHLIPPHNPYPLGRPIAPEEKKMGTKEIKKKKSRAAPDSFPANYFKWNLIDAVFAVDFVETKNIDITERV